MNPPTNPEAHSHIATVTVGALKRRINRKLRHEGEVLKSTRGERWRNDLSDHYVIDRRTNGVVAQHVDLEVLGREIGVLKDWERVCTACDYTVGSG